jgi:hypothetical protein
MAAVQLATLLLQVVRAACCSWYGLRVQWLRDKGSTAHVHTAGAVSKGRWCSWYA